jgi:hypothetical protein
LFFVQPILAQTIVGVSPVIVDLGEISKGESKIGSFYVISPTDEKLLIRLETLSGSIDFFKTYYKESIMNVSEEDAKDWIKFINNPVELEPPKEEIRLLKGSVKGAREINFILEVPRDAEPGYHMVRIRPSPVISETPTEGGVGIKAITVIDIKVVFKISGDAIRDGRVLDIVTGNYIGDDLEVKILFQNYGTTTLNVNANPIKVLKNGNEIATLSPVSDFVKPGETKELRTLLNTRNITTGEYEIVANVSYSTDTISFSSTIQVYPKPEVAPKKEFKLPYTLIFAILIIILTIYLVYRFI